MDARPPILFLGGLIRTQLLATEAMMATAIGTNTLTSLSRRLILPHVMDIVYGSNAKFVRLNKGRRKVLRGGYQIEAPVMYKKFTTGGSASLGFDVIPNTPQDTIFNAAWDWKQIAIGLSIDKLTLIEADSPEKVFDLLKTQWEQLEMHFGDIMGTQIHSDGTTADDIEGTELAIDDGGVNASYAGINRSTYTGWAANDDSTSATLSVAALRSLFLDCKHGASTVSFIESRVDQYARYLALGDSAQELPVGAMGHDEQLLSLGFTNAYFMNVPWVEDEHQFDGPDASNSAITMANERFEHLGVSPMAEFSATPFREAMDGKVYVSNVDWAGNYINTNPRTMGKLTAIAA